MTTTSWIIVAVVAVVLIIAALVIAGLIITRRRKISFSTPEAPDKPLTQQEKSGNYQAAQGFSFSEGAGKIAQPAARGRTDQRQDTPAEPDTAPAAATEAADIAADTAGAAEADTAESAAPRPEAPRPAEPGPAAVPELPVEEKPAATGEPQAAPEAQPWAAPDPSQGAQPGVIAADQAIAEAAPAVDVPVAEAVPAVVPTVDAPAPTEGRLERLRGRLARSQSTLGKGVLGVLGAGDLDEDAWEEIEDTLLIADLGATVTTSVLDKLRQRIALRPVRSEAEARALLREVLIEELRPEMDRSLRALPHETHPAVIMVVGVNGTGKTTTTGKLARVLVADGRRVLLGAADTFRAAAADQLQTWGDRVGATTVRGPEGADPASIAFESVSAGIAEGVDAIIVDTAGRLHTKSGLMDELGKVKRVIEKRAETDEVILVLDATIGQNGLAQARVFQEVVTISGVALTKLDGTAKGGIVFQVQQELGVPVKLVGLGEGADDLAPFVPEAFVDALLG